MGERERSVAARVTRKGRGPRLALLLALLTFVFAALVTSSPGADEPNGAGDSDAEPLTAPSEEAEAEHRAREEREEKRRRTPEAKEERRKSRTAYRDASASEARALAKRKFEVLEKPLWEPPKLSGDERLGSYLGDHAQLVERADGEAPSVIDSLLPLRARNDSGKRGPIDIELEDRGEGFAPQNAIVDTRLPRKAGAGVAFKASGVRIRPLGRDLEALAALLERAAKPGGLTEAAAERRAEDLELGRPQAEARKLEEKLFYPDAEADTDLILAPVPTGVEVFYVLRSKDSPEEQVLELDMPDGASLRLVDGGGAGAEVVEDGERVMSIAPPRAQDATGKEIPVSYEVDGDRLVVEVSHRDEDILYPALVDPVIEEQKDWEINPAVGYQGWSFSENYPGFEYSLDHEDYGRGLTVEAPPGTLASKAGVAFNYRAPGNAFVYRGEFWYANHEPYNSYVTRGLYLPCPGCDPRGDATADNNDRATSSDFDSDLPSIGICARSGCPVDGTQGNRMMFQLRMTDGSRYRERRTLAHLGGARVFLHDNFNPSVAGLTHDPPLGAGGWTNRLDHKVAVRGTDGGLGIKKFFFLPPPGVRQDREDVNCTAQCPREKTEEFAYLLEEGLHTIKAQVADNVERNSPISEWPVKVDRVEPKMTTSGTLKDSAGRWSTTGGTLRIAATDEDPLRRPQGGITSIDVLVDGQRVDGVKQACEQGGCSLSHAFTFPDPQYPDSRHEVEVVVTDQAGNTRRESHTVRLDRAAPEVTLGGDLPPYDGRWLPRDRETLPLRVDATDGNTERPGSGVKSIVIEVDGVERGRRDQDATCEVTQENCALSYEFQFAQALYGEGSHNVSAVVTDRAGLVTKRSFEVKVDRSAPGLALSGTLKEADNQIVNQASYTLQADAQDGDAANLRSGAKSIEILVDGARKDFIEQPCDAGSCSLSRSWVFRGEDYAEGPHTVTVRAEDQLGNKTEQSLTVTYDRQGPVLLLSRNLWDDYSPDARYVREALYDPSYELEVKAEDTVAGTAGVNAIDIFVDRPGQPRSTEPVSSSLPQVCAVGQCPSRSHRYTFTTDRSDDGAAREDGVYLIRVVGRDTLGQSSEKTWPVIVDRKGSIYQARDTLKADEGDPTVGTEWDQLDAPRSRREEPDFIVTRQDDEVRARTRETDADPDAEEGFTLHKGSSASDVNLERVSELAGTRDSVQDDDFEQRSTGPIHEVLEGEQIPPPDYGPQYERYEGKYVKDNKEYDTEIWVDDLHKQPIKQIMRDDDGDVAMTRLWQYHHSRFEPVEVPPTLFSEPRPNRTGMDKRVQENGGAPQGPTEDTETGGEFLPFSLGPTVQLPSRGFCFVGSTTVRQEVSQSTGAPPPDPDLGPSDAPSPSATQPSTETQAYYSDLVSGEPSCLPGVTDVPTPPLTVSTMARGGSQAADWRHLYVERAAEIDGDPANEHAARGGTVPVLIGGSPATAYVLPTDDERLSALVEVGDSTILVDGPYDKDDVPALLNQLGEL